MKKPKDKPKVIRKQIRWCFGCRKRTLYKYVYWPHDWIPAAMWQCSVCRQDRTVFGE